MNTRSKWLRLAPALVGVLITATAGGGAAYFIKRFIDTPPPQPKKVVQQVLLIRPPPPPPVIERPPEPPKVDEEKINEPDPTPDTPSDQPPGNLLGLDAEGGAGADGFGLLGRKGGRDLLASGGDRYAWYASALKDDLVSFLSEHSGIRQRAYSVNVRLWLDGKGAVTRVALAGSTGDHELDRELQTLLGSMEKVAQTPPVDLPQPVQIRIVSRL